MGTLRNPKRVLSKALKFTGKDGSREILTCVHLDERGEVAACDTYRLFTATGWSGPSINVPADLARKMAKIPAKYAEVEVEQVGDVIECRYGGNVLKGDVVEGEYPKYHQLMNGWEASAVSEVPAKQAAVICRAHKRDGVFVEVGDGSTVVWGAGCDTEPSVMFRTGCQGEGRVKLNAEYLESALKACGEKACIKVMNERKPVLVAWGGMSVMVMPIMAGTFTEPLIKKQASKREEKVMAKQPKKEEHMDIKLNGEHICITGTLPGMTRNEAFTRLKAVGGVPCESFTKKVTLMVIAANCGKSKRAKLDKAIENGQEVRVIDGHEFVEALKKAEEEQTAKAIEMAAKRKGANVKATVTKDDGVTAIVMEPEKKEDSMEKRIAELEKELKATRKELDEVWKENASLKAKKQKEVPPAPKKPQPKDAAAVVSLKTMEAWCEGKGLIASQKREGTCIWVEGESTPYREELTAMGFRFAKKRKSWYFNPAA